MHVGTVNVVFETLLCMYVFYWALKLDEHVFSIATKTLFV